MVFGELLVTSGDAKMWRRCHSSLFFTVEPSIQLQPIMVARGALHRRSRIHRSGIFTIPSPSITSPKSWSIFHGETGKSWRHPQEVRPLKQPEREIPATRPERGREQKLSKVARHSCRALPVIDAGRAMLPRGADSAWAPAALVSVLLLPFDVAEVHDRSVVPP
jgi:hypothetical protein